jgi:luciferase family oxidoreductase group 1
VTPLSVLDLSPIVEGGTAADALRNTISLAQHAERRGYRRYWLAEHHNMPGIASAATAVVIGQVGAATSRIRVGAGGIMLPNHAPLQVAEQFGTLESLFPGRVDLGLGRAPGTDPAAAIALRRTLDSHPERFLDDVLDVMAFLGPPQPRHAVRAVPGAGLNVPIWILGSSTFGAGVAAELGLPFAFASHFAPGLLFEALALYRARFRPSETLAEPRVMLGVNVVAAPTDDEAARDPSEPSDPLQRTRVSFVGAPQTVSVGLHEFVDRTGADEVIVVSHIYDHGARLRSYELLAEAMAG